MTMTVTNTTTAIHQEQIIEIARHVWSSLLGMTLHPFETTESQPGDVHSTTAAVHISGSRNVSVILSCPTTLAGRAAAAMFEMGEDELEDGEVADAVGELVNIIGGNIKCLLPEPSQLSLPTVLQGGAQVVTVPGSRLMEHVELECGGDRLSIAVWNRQDDPRTGSQAEPDRRAR
jgi:chemotaxis protein CheX